MRFSSSSQQKQFTRGAVQPRHALATARGFYHRGRLKSAERVLRRMLGLYPRDLDALLLLAEIDRRKNRLKSAEMLARRAIVAVPNSAHAHQSLGVVLKQQCHLGRAASQFRRALSLSPGLVDAHLDLGDTLHHQGYLSQAVASFLRALDFQPTLASAHYRLGNAYFDQGKIHLALDCYRRAVALQPDYAAALNNLAFAMNYDYEATPAEVYAPHRAWAALFPEPSSVRVHHNDHRPDRRLRIGYVSGDFWAHAVSYFFEPLVQFHDRREFEVFCYSASNPVDDDETTARLKSHADHWLSLFSLDDESAAGLVREDKIDILVDLGGLTGHSRIEVFALKPAPVQATWLGYLNTTGLSAIDYRITDAITDPEPDADQWSRETLFRLPSPSLCYRPFDDAPPVSPPPMERAGYVTFGSFNNLPKLTPNVIKLWARLLRAVADSRLILKTEQMRDGATANDLLYRFADEGISPERIDLLAWRVHTYHHLARYGLIDIALDPFPVNGVTTTCEALWMGVPVVTLKGDRPYGRVGASILRSVGLGELVAEDPDTYIEIAKRLGRDRSRLAELRSRLRDQMRASTLCDGPAFAKSMEHAYRHMWRRWCPQAANSTSEQNAK